MTLNEEQKANKEAIERVAAIVGIDPKWVVAVALTESSLGMSQKSPTGCRGIFQMSSIAMKDLLLSMEANDDDMADILCGIAFLWLLYKRHGGSIEAATLKFCDPEDKDFYWERVKNFMEKGG
jgi:membrane-bound lytic murein transglycosylase MltF